MQIEVERQHASVTGIMSTSEFASLELSDNTKKVGAEHTHTLLHTLDASYNGYTSACTSA